MESETFITESGFSNTNGQTLYNKWLQTFDSGSVSFSLIGIFTDDDKPHNFFKKQNKMEDEIKCLYIATPDDNEIINNKKNKRNIPKKYKKLYKQLKRLKKEAEDSGSEYSHEYDNDGASDYEFGKASAFKEVIELITIKDEQR